MYRQVRQVIYSRSRRPRSPPLWLSSGAKAERSAESAALKRCPGESELKSPVKRPKRDGRKRKRKGNKMATPTPALSPTTTPAPTPPANPMSDLDAACQALVQFRQKPLLVLYYPSRARMNELDLDYVYQSLRSHGVTVENKLPQLDVLIDSYGGNPVAAYRLAQLIRDMASNVYFLVASHAYSAATLLCLAGNEIRFGHYAGLSPIDITLVSDPPARRQRAEVELATVDGFIEFAKRARQVIEDELKKADSESETRVESDLLVQMVKEVGALQVGKYFRERMLTGHYAKELLNTYMFANLPDRAERTEDLTNNLLFGTPAHNFHLDYHFCERWNLAVEEMPTEESDLAKKVIEVLEKLTDDEIICRRLSRKLRFPFFDFYPLVPPSSSTGGTQ